MITQDEIDRIQITPEWGTGNPRDHFELLVRAIADYAYARGAWDVVDWIVRYCEPNEEWCFWKCYDPLSEPMVQDWLTSRGIPRPEAR
jgi:hypothetical protein